MRGVEQVQPSRAGAAREHVGPPRTEKVRRSSRAGRGMIPEKSWSRNNSTRAHPWRSRGLRSTLLSQRRQAGSSTRPTRCRSPMNAGTAGKKKGTLIGGCPSAWRDLRHVTRRDTGRTFTPVCFGKARWPTCHLPVQDRYRELRAAYGNLRSHRTYGSLLSKHTLPYR